MISSLQEPDELRKRLQGLYRIDEKSYARFLTEKTEILQDSKIRIYNTAKQIIEKIKLNKNSSVVDAFIQEYGLSNDEGIALMCLAESLLRIPDNCTINDLIKDTLVNSAWSKHIGRSSSVFINASTWGLLISGRVLKDKGDNSKWYNTISNLIKNMGEPIIRKAVIQAMYTLGKNFIMGTNIEEALDNKGINELYSFNVLGESVITMESAEKYFQSYMHVIKAIGSCKNSQNLLDSHGISVKLSTLHPRYEFSQISLIIDDLMFRLLEICKLAKHYNISVYIAAEEASRLEISLIVFEKLCLNKSLEGWDGLGFTVQAYQKRALAVIDFLEDIAIRSNRKILLQLVKGAYWDYEIKNTQELGLIDYPVFTRKVYTDVSYLACAQRILNKPNNFYPCFATHNAYTLATILEIANKDHPGFEFQRLYGVAQNLHDYITQELADNIKCRIFAPIGDYQDLLSYFVRMLLEQGANNSFINRVNDSNISIDKLLEDPLEKAKFLEYLPHPSIPLPRDLFGSDRINSAGTDITDSVVVSSIKSKIENYKDTLWKSCPIINGQEISNDFQQVFSPSNLDIIGEVSFTTSEQAIQALDIAHQSVAMWKSIPVIERAAMLDKAADELENDKLKFINLLIKEGGKVLYDAILEVREAIDFLRYYAMQARKELREWQKLPSPVGEENYIYFDGRGVFLCISPFNFPLSIFLGPIAAALVAGNTVLAKPAEQTSIIAYEVVKLLYNSGIPKNVLHFIPGKGKILGEVLLSNSKISGVAFTGSIETANIINKNIAKRSSGIIPFIAETGGLNTMIVDSSALIEQVTNDVIVSAFKSTGQRCSALRILFIQEEIADKQIKMICGAMKELRIGDPMLLETDLGPVIDKSLYEALIDHTQKMSSTVKLLYKCEIGNNKGYFFPPHIYEIESLSQLEKEVFGPVLHVIRYKKSDLPKILNDINDTKYGLTFAVQSRIQSNIDDITDKINAGNIYVNRRQIGAVVGVQPFGGQGLSGTGPKAGGPYYLHRFLTEKVVTINTTILGGNIPLMCLDDDV
ncbi:bifunctional proline dehydrogenase/L-glutamate gamma-semialdehyde dehydrogenase PutA [Neoehrlichia mikurensis]|uniref:Bifunctional protein PutA n=1 Tax=Neoehrlichia mikurensis TaxID=89586 RepID=A0A9Q9F3I0_9RICK|nr:bifunctional proline dehydrogenase/L-glutamate gamma-semialdehyde dehydrogenase PutA [Neoehrlichia mikurensis]QXK91938.1 bifunctional proline dehydrogenase/L-glutamate gamma-semialdehyde dehydrogenase PutA [Neoehrlichia mikurensis]QXK93151.1 bifunctional proline dehydrogenase/L-glutamate gamma-semialdehyde dehydrogenase PutA [Neoehrlichia mikurensis]QXK93631.1 bifunctional proline dehydrogenase/L-glutamate gamma-semialdehyde dehydrogenase PutA [Neoehrlichia mikurensis]UTO55414.1 bifunctional